MKKIILIASILLLASACSKKTPELTAPVQNQPAQNFQATTAPSYGAVVTPPTATPKPAPMPVTLSIYNNTAENYKILYLSYFSLLTPAQISASNKTANSSACVPYGIKPDVCFAFKNQNFQNTNLTSAAMAVRVLKDKKTIAECGAFSQQELEGGSALGAVQGGSVVFITAKTSDAGAGNFSETHFNRAFLGTVCYELDETIRWANAQNFSPPRTEFSHDDVWGSLDILRNGFHFINNK